MVQIDAGRPAALQADRGKKLHPLSVRPWLAGLLVIASVTFVAGYYAPLGGANDELREQVKELSLEYQRAVAGFEATNAKLAASERLSDERKNALGKINAAESTAVSALTNLYKEIDQALEPLSSGKLVSVDKGHDSAIVTIDARFLIYPHKTFVHPQGKDLLCKIARALPKSTGRPSQVVAIANGDKPSSKIVEKQFPTSWQLSAGLAAEIAAELSNCGIAGTELRAVGAGHFDGDAKLAKKSPARFEIHVYPDIPFEGAAE